jgi:hypothetical protein
VRRPINFCSCRPAKCFGSQWTAMGSWKGLLAMCGRFPISPKLLQGHSGEKKEGRRTADLE